MTEKIPKELQPRIFISYRRADDESFVNWLLDKLKQAFHEDNIFFDRFTIRAGFDFRDEIKRGVQKVEVMLVMVGHKWQELLDMKKDQEADYMRIEIQSALELDKIVIPVLINNAQMPKKNDLPYSIRDLVFRESIEIETKRMDHDIQLLIDNIIESVKEQRSRTRVQPFQLLDAHEAWVRVSEQYWDESPADGLLNAIGQYMRNCQVMSINEGKHISIETSDEYSYRRLEHLIVQEWLEREVSKMLGTKVDITINYYDSYHRQYGDPDDFESIPPF